jgi:hypothetical protein
MTARRATLPLVLAALATRTRTGVPWARFWTLAAPASTSTYCAKAANTRPNSPRRRGRSQRSPRIFPSPVTDAAKSP